MTEQAELLRHGKTGVLKIAGSPQHIESVLTKFLHRYAERYPQVQVKISELLAACDPSTPIGRRPDVATAICEGFCTKRQRSF
ncbi:hypothetical protein [Bradyrhizobium jicamae]|uniref:hypothetical protein n=1 Tax=Bradyrhizobium jicamae TaxID=280332 RepID=UPI001BAAD94F|nr:hypothetical protein [Bradyrhizobium jicamae]MBR0932900.1 hypothetical protein [Bradyrhizobium jicamae]